jgi:hypothetical protein
MRIKSFARLLLVLLSMVSLAACNIGGASPTPIIEPTLLASPEASPQASPAVETPSAAPTTGPSTGQGACANPLYPIVPNATWTYAGNGQPSGSYSYTDTISEVRPDGFTITSQFDDNLTRTQQWACKPEGLVALQLSGAAAVITTEGMSAELETSNVQGVTLPASVAPGDQWTFSLDMHGTQEMSGVTAETTGHVVYNFTAVGTESVTVPAGTFDAMKIEGDLTMDITATVSGIAVPVTVTMHTISWFAPGVGMVRTDTTGDMLGTAISDKLELQSYNIP